MFSNSTRMQILSKKFFAIFCILGNVYLHPSTQEVQMYPISTNNTESRRSGSYISFVLLGMFCCLAFTQNSIFVEWNPIANSALSVFSPEWSASTLAWQINLATITSPIFQWPVWWAIQKYG